jgi:putative membrane protein
MLDEHTRMNRELTDLAARKRFALSQTVDQRAAFCAQSLAGLSGEDFDRCYAKAQYLAHMGSLAAFEAEAERGQDADMKALASRGVTHIKDHCRQIKPIAEKYMKDDDHDRKAGRDRDEK